MRSYAKWGSSGALAGALGLLVVFAMLALAACGGSGTAARSHALAPFGWRWLRPRPRDDRHRTPPLTTADKHRHPAKLWLLEQPPLHRPPWQPDRHEARHMTPAFPPDTLLMVAPGRDVPAHPRARSSTTSAVRWLPAVTADQLPPTSVSRSRRSRSVPPGCGATAILASAHDGSPCVTRGRTKRPTAPLAAAANCQRRMAVDHC